MTDVTKACVRMLKFERVIREIIKFPFKLLFVVLEKLFGWINWCVIRSVLRLFGIPLLIGGLIILCTMMNKYGFYDPWSAIDALIILGDLIAMVVVLCGCIYSWDYITTKEQEILDGKV